MKKFMMALGCVGLCSAAALADKVPQKLSGGIKLMPVRVAPLNADGTPGEWQYYASPETNGCPGKPFFDHAEINWDANADGICDAADPFDTIPADSTCTLGTSRWYFGPSYLNPFAANDFTGSNTGDADDYSFAWYWGGVVGDPDRNCVIIISVYDSNSIADDPGDCSSTPVQQTDTSFLGGIIFDFGPIPAGTGYYYTAAADLCSGFALCVPMPADGEGAYHFIAGTYSDTDPASIFLDTGLGTQAMLWGDYNTADAKTQGTVQYDDDVVVDGSHLAGSECYTYSFGLCPDPLGSMTAIYAQRVDTDPCPEDCSGDGVRDQGDLALLLSCYNGGPCCDINGDGVTDQADLAALLAVYNTACP